jgi:hypothetical protein
MAALVVANGEQVSDYPALDAIYPVNCNIATPNLCPNDFEITDAIIALLEGGYTLNQIEAAAKIFGSADADRI